MAVDYVSPLEAVFPETSAAVLAVLARTSRPLTLRQIADRAGVSHPQVGRHVERLEGLGVVHREVVGRSHQVSLTASAAGDLVRRFAELGRDVTDRMRESAGRLEPNAMSVVAFGSFARGTADASSDIDVAIVAHDPDDEEWLEQLSAWTHEMAAFAGSPVAEILAGRDEFPDRSDDPLWASVCSEGITIAGQPIRGLVQRPLTASRR